MKPYPTYRRLPSLGGLCTMEEAMKPGLSVEQCVTRLKRYHYAFKRLHQISIARLTAEPIYELKMAFSLHAYYCAEHVTALRQRVGEMREPPLGLEQLPHKALEIFFDEILSAPKADELLLGLYEKALPAVEAVLQRHIGDTNRLTDAPSARLCRFALLEVGDMIAFGRQAIEKLVSPEKRAVLKPWLQLLDDCLAVAGGVHGADPAVEKKLERQFSAKPYQFD